MAFSRPPLKSRGNIQGNLTGKKNKTRVRLPAVDCHALLSDLRNINDSYATQDCSVTLTETDLTNPTAESVKAVYCMLLNALVEFSPDQFSKIPLSQTVVRHPELHDEFLHRQQYIKVMRRLMDAIQAPNGLQFQVSDLFAPESKRTAQLFGSIVNFLKFSNFLAGQANLRETEEQSKLAHVKVEEMSDKRLQLIDQKRQLEKQKVEEHELEEELTHKISEVDSELLHLNQQQEQLNSQLQRLDERGHAEDKRAAELEEQLDHCQRRMEDLQLNVVSSPEELKAEQALVHQQIEEAKESRDDATKLVSMWESLASRAHEIPPPVESVTEEIDLLIPKAKSCNLIIQDLEQVEETISKQKQSLKELSAKHQNLTRKLKLVEEERSQLSLENQRRPAVQASDELFRDVQLLQQQLSSKKGQDVRSNEDVELETKMIEDERKRLEAQKIEATAIVEKIKKNFVRHQSRMNAALGSLSSL